MGLFSKIEDMLVGHAMAPYQSIDKTLRAARKEKAKLSNNVNPLLSDFPDNHDGIVVGKRIIQANITEADEIVVNIQMIDGSIGNLTIKATTLAQIIIDRNARAVPQEVEAPPEVTAIDVGDGDLGGSNPQAQLSNIVDADELLNASRKRPPIPKRYA